MSPDTIWHHFYLPSRKFLKSSNRRDIVIESVPVKGVFGKGIVPSSEPPTPDAIAPSIRSTNPFIILLVSYLFNSCFRSNSLILDLSSVISAATVSGCRIPSSKVRYGMFSNSMFLLLGSRRLLENTPPILLPYTITVVKPTYHVVTAAQVVPRVIQSKTSTPAENRSSY